MIKETFKNVDIEKYVEVQRVHHIWQITDNYIYLRKTCEILFDMSLRYDRMDGRIDTTINSFWSLFFDSEGSSSKFLDAPASLRPILESKWVINVFEIDGYYLGIKINQIDTTM